MAIHALLQELGFSGHEARAYASLVGAGTRNGYEVAKAAGLPRANVYRVLEKLVARGAAERLDTPKGSRYAAIPPDRLFQRLESEHRRRVKAAEEAFADLAREEDTAAPVFNLQGREQVLARARAKMDAARDTLLIALQPPEAAALAPTLREARERGVAISTLCMEGCESECGGCQGNITRCGLAPDDGKRWFLLVADGEWMIAGEISEARTEAVATSQRLVVELAASYIRQSVALATMAGELGERFRGLLSEEARQILDALHPESGFFTRLDKMVDAKTM
ncbi:MAG: hypothetical protein L0I62_05730 [Gammaproteobacteria bacterium]|nr:hypothetical protein [Gammaproteobacteria bacterium]